MTATINRRALMHTAALAALLLSGRRFGAGAAQAQTSSTTPFVDPHCHIFNVSDLPLGGFLYHVIVREQAHQIYDSILGDLIDFPDVPVFIDLVAKVLKGKDEEEAAISLGASGWHQYSGDARGTENADRRMLKCFLLSLRLIDPPAGNTLNFHLPVAIPKHPSSKSAAKTIAFLIKAAQSFVDDTHSKATLASLQRFQKVKAADWNAVQLALDDVELHVFGPVGDTEIGRTIRWLLMIMRSRASILQELDALTPASLGKFRFYTPALVDFDYWLGAKVVDDVPGADDPAESVPIARQVNLMQSLSLAQPPGYALNALVAFDPLRAVIQWLRAGKQGEPKALSDVKEAIRSRGCVGVKLYPPMGFWPCDNAANIKLFYEHAEYSPTQKLYGFGHLAPQHFSEWPEMTLPSEHAKVDSSFIAQRNAALDRQAVCFDTILKMLYDFCIDEDVPIMAHCSRGQGSFDAGTRKDRFTSERRAAPKYWMNLLEAKIDGVERKYAKLRLNLGHMGGVWCLGAPYGKKGDEHGTWEYENKFCDLYTKEQDGTRELPYWTERLFEMIAMDDPTLKPRFPNLYADLSDWEEYLRFVKAAEDGEEGLKALIGESSPSSAYLRAESIPATYSRIRINAKRVRSRLMYGTDFVLLGRAPKFGDYFGKVTAGLDSLFTAEERDGFLGGNALRFMGLTPNIEGKMDRPMERLVGFYVKNDLRDKANEILAAFGHSYRVPA